MLFLCINSFNGIPYCFDNLKSVSPFFAIIFVSELTGKIIKAVPTQFLKKIKNFISTLDNNEGKIEIFISEDDFKVLEKNKDIKAKLKTMNISHKAELLNGEVVLQINGIKIKHKVVS